MKKYFKNIILFAMVLIFILYICFFRVSIASDYNIYYYFLDYRLDNNGEDGTWIKYRIDFDQEDQDNIKKMFNNKLIGPKIIEDVTFLFTYTSQKKNSSKKNSDVYFEVNGEDDKYILCPSLDYRKDDNIIGRIPNDENQLYIYLGDGGYIKLNKEELKKLNSIIDKYIDNHKNITEIGRAF